jgi:hypothetical protein
MIERGVEGVVCSFGAVRVFNGGFRWMGIMGELVCGGRRVLDKLVVGTVGAVAAVGDITNAGGVAITGAAGSFGAAGCISAVGVLEDFGAVVVAVDAPGAVGALGDAFP